MMEEEKQASWCVLFFFNLTKSLLTDAGSKESLAVLTDRTESGLHVFSHYPEAVSERGTRWD